MPERLYRENVKFSVAVEGAFANPNQPTILELNDPTLVFDITCALDEDGTEFTLGDPDLDESLSFCDAAGSQTATFKNPSVVYQYFLDEDRAANGYMALARKLLSFPDVPLIGILRIGQDSDVAYASGQRINLVGGKTDLPVSVQDSGSNARQQTTLLGDGFVNWGYKLP